MSSGYTRLPMADPGFLTDKDKERAFTYGAPPSAVDMTKSKMYNSIFDYAGQPAEKKDENEPPIRDPILTCMTHFVTFLTFIGFVLTLPISGWFCLKTIHNYERMVVFRLGRLLAAKGPGIVLVLPCIDRVVKVDLRMKAFSVPPQKILTNDNAAIEGGADVYYRVADPVMCVTGVQDLDNSIRVLSQTILQNHLNKQTLHDIENNRPSLGMYLQESINKMTKKWGVEVGRIDISQIKVIQGPTGGTNNQAQNLLNMIAPGLVPAGSSALPQLPGMQNLMSQVAAPQTTNQNFLGSLLSGMSGSAPGAFPAGGSTAPAILPMDEGMEGFSPQPTVPVCNPHDLINKVQRHLSPELVREFGLVYKFVIKGPQGGVFFVDLKNGEGSAGHGDPSGIPDATLSLTVEDMNLILTGGLSAFSAYMSGQLTILGDVQGAMRLGQLIEKLN